MIAPGVACCWEPIYVCALSAGTGLCFFFSGTYQAIRPWHNSVSARDVPLHMRRSGPARHKEDPGSLTTIQPWRPDICQAAFVPSRTGSRGAPDLCACGHLSLLYVVTACAGRIRGGGRIRGHAPAETQTVVIHCRPFPSLSTGYI